MSAGKPLAPRLERMAREKARYFVEHLFAGEPLPAVAEKMRHYGTNYLEPGRVCYPMAAMWRRAAEIVDARFVGLAPLPGGEPVPAPVPVQAAPAQDGMPGALAAVLRVLIVQRGLVAAHGADLAYWRRVLDCDDGADERRALAYALLRSLAGRVMEEGPAAVLAWLDRQAADLCAELFLPRRRGRVAHAVTSHPLPRPPRVRKPVGRPVRR